jgi:hypothetical protein
MTTMNYRAARALEIAIGEAIKGLESELKGLTMPLINSLPSASADYILSQTYVLLEAIESLKKVSKLYDGIAWEEATARK